MYTQVDLMKSSRLLYVFTEYVFDESKHGHDDKILPNQV